MNLVYLEKEVRVHYAGLRSARACSEFFTGTSNNKGLTPGFIYTTMTILYIIEKYMKRKKDKNEEDFEPGKRSFIVTDITFAATECAQWMRYNRRQWQPPGRRVERV